MSRAQEENMPVRLSWCQLRRLKRGRSEIEVVKLLALAKLDAKEKIQSRAMDLLAAVSEQEARIVQANPSDADRAQFLGDKATHALGARIDDHSERQGQI